MVNQSQGRGGSTHNPPPELFPKVLRRRLIVSIRDHFIQTRNKVHLRRLDEPALQHESRDGEQDRGEHEWYVIRDEGGRVPVTPKEDGEAAEEEDDRDGDDTVPCRVWLERGFKWEEVSVETLSVPAGSEPKVGLR